MLNYSIVITLFTYAYYMHTHTQLAREPAAAFSLSHTHTHAKNLSSAAWAIQLFLTLLINTIRCPLPSPPAATTASSQCTHLLTPQTNIQSLSLSPSQFFALFGLPYSRALCACLMSCVYNYTTRAQALQTLPWIFHHMRILHVHPNTHTHAHSHTNSSSSSKFNKNKNNNICF